MNNFDFYGFPLFISARAEKILEKPVAHPELVLRQVIESSVMILFSIVLL